MGLRIGIDCDGVLRDFIPDLVNKIKEIQSTYKELKTKLSKAKSEDEYIDVGNW